MSNWRSSTLARDVQSIGLMISLPITTSSFGGTGCGDNPKRDPLRCWMNDQQRMTPADEILILSWCFDANGGCTKTSWPSFDLAIHEAQSSPELGAMMPGTRQHKAGHDDEYD